MKFTVLIAAAALVASTVVADAKPYRTLVRDMQGTTFIITVDFETNVVRADLRRNPAKLAGADLERQLQVAVGFGSSMTCGIKKEGREKLSKSEIQGTLHCDWFDMPIVNPTGAWPNQEPTS